MIEPGRPAASSRCTTACATKNAALTLRSKTASKSASVTATNGLRAVGPGIVDEDVERPCSAIAAAAAARSVDVEHQGGCLAAGLP